MYCDAAPLPLAKSADYTGIKGRPTPGNMAEPAGEPYFAVDVGESYEVSDARLRFASATTAATACATGTASAAVLGVRSSSSCRRGRKSYLTTRTRCKRSWLSICRRRKSQSLSEWEALPNNALHTDRGRIPVLQWPGCAIARRCGRMLVSPCLARGACDDCGSFRPNPRRFPAALAVPPLYSGAGSRARFEIDHPGALIFRDGVAVFLGPGGVPVIFDHEGVEQFVADLAGQPPP